MACVFQLTEENADQIVEVPQPYPAHWFPQSAAEFEPPDGWKPTRMNWFDCSGRYISVLAEDGVPFTFEYPDIEAPVILGAESYYMNERDENPIPVASGAGGFDLLAAGVVGIGHSPQTLRTMEEVFAWHDRDLATQWGGAIMERAFVRARMIEWDRYLLAVGGLVQGVTQVEREALQNLESSIEFLVIRNSAGTPRLQIVTTSMVDQGNTRTSASSTERLAASIRVVDETPEPEEPTMAETQTASVTWTTTDNTTAGWEIRPLDPNITTTPTELQLTTPETLSFSGVKWVPESVEKASKCAACGEGAEAPAAPEEETVEDEEPETVGLAEMQEQMQAINDLIPDVDVDISPLEPAQ